jgi:hypothetical protein
MPDPARAVVSRSIDIDAAPERVWELVSDLPRMGQLSPENTGGRWLRGTTGPTLGARFRGANRRGWRRWSTAVEVTACDPGRTFAFDVSSLGLAVARWTYDLAPRSGGGCTLTESWQDRRGWLMDLIGPAATGVGDRAVYTGRSIEHTLARVKERAEVV